MFTQILVALLIACHTSAPIAHDVVKQFGTIKLGIGTKTLDFLFPDRGVETEPTGDPIDLTGVMDVFSTIAPDDCATPKCLDFDFPSDTNTNQAKAKLVLGDIDGAIADCDRALRLDGANLNARKLLAIACVMRAGRCGHK